MSRPKLAILLPPSEKKATGGRGRPWAPGSGVLPALDPARVALADALRAAGDTGAPAADARTRRSIDRYQGVLYVELDAGSLGTAEKGRLTRQVLIFSGLYGVVGPADPLPDHRLKMGDTVPGIGRPASYWRPLVTAALADRLQGAVAWDLLSGEYGAAWSPGQVPLRRRITARFVDAEGRTVSHWNKLLKGALVRHVLAEQPASAAELTSFDHPLGYQYDPEASTGIGTAFEQAVFTERR